MRKRRKRKRIILAIVLLIVAFVVLLVTGVLKKLGIDFDLKKVGSKFLGEKEKEGCDGVMRTYVGCRTPDENLLNDQCFRWIYEPCGSADSNLVKPKGRVDDEDDEVSLPFPVVDSGGSHSSGNRTLMVEALV